MLRSRQSRAVLRQTVSKTQHEQLLRSQHGLGKAVERLPYELLVAIFMLAAQEHNNFPAVAVLVCRMWRNVALDHSPLWAFLWLNHRSPKSKYLLWNQRLGTHYDDGRHITVVVPVDEQVCNADWQYIVLALSTRTYPITSFHFDGSIRALDYIYLGAGPLGSCEELSLHVDSDSVRNSSPYSCCCVPIWPRCGDVSAPRVLSFSSIAVEFFFDPDHLTILELFDLSDSTFPDPRILMTALGRMPLLRTLVIEYTGFRGGHDFLDLPGIRRPSNTLTHLQLSGNWSIGKFMASIDLPNVQTFVLDNTPASALDILRILAQPSPPLRTLSLSRTRLDLNLLLHSLSTLPVLSALSSITLLDIGYSSFSETLVRQFYRPLVFSPSLDSLTLYGDNGRQEIRVGDSFSNSEVLCDECPMGYDIARIRKNFIDGLMKRSPPPTCDYSSPVAAEHRKNLQQSLKPATGLRAVLVDTKRRMQRLVSRRK
ncbi:hypothetical protein SISSUDRAFT_1045662 [Sistotremastrum suecicum HHB10207 ss-3]|uniref:Uncharacterized protein n=1 Tax=Sistotremastrum suecicum HHB10207 ss-3 TaxID=1314776 RepID=A0A166EA71_9AGAM|nr:hypothetical protein SISSUDRAFT_1045662 [Sistotremastrum suecicum HHB10207 ss-3]